MSVEPTQKSQPPSSIEEEPGYVERGVQWLARTVFHFQAISREERVRKWLLDHLKNHTICPAVMIHQFQRRVTREERSEIFEKIGRQRPLSWQDRLLNRYWRDEWQAGKRFREMGREAVRQNPYLLAPRLEQVLKEPLQCRCD
jgi:hypothetical protein